MADENALRLYNADLGRWEERVPTAAEMTAWLTSVTAAFAPLLQAMREFDAQIGALGRAYWQVIEAFGQRMAEDSWTWSGDAARWRPESEPGEPATGPAGIR